MRRHAGLSLLFTAALPLGLAAQDYTWEQIDELGVKYRVFQKLKRIPLKLGMSHPNLRARYQPADEGDYIWGSKGRFSWDFKIFEFVPDKTAPVTGAQPKSREEAEALARAKAEKKHTATSFREFVTSKDPDNTDRKFLPQFKGKEYKKNRGHGSKLPYRWWEYTDTKQMTNGRESFDQLWYNCAAVYDFGDREIALVTYMPVKRGSRLESKYMSWAKNMLLSLSLLKDSEVADGADEGTDKLYRHAQTPERRKAVDAAKANIANLENWDIFATESYIVLYSWPAKRPDKKRKYYLESKEIGEDMDRMRELYKQYYPPAEGTVFPYSVMRICSTDEEFHKYSDNPNRGVIGWFSPASKELVLFIDNDKDQTKTVAFHEGWHQYSDTYFPRVELQRWFDEGTGDFFGSFEWRGGKWRYDVSKMRKVSIKTIVNSKDFVPLNEIVSWSREKFYGAKAPNYYAQGYAMVDFLQRGKDERAAGWDEGWEHILEKYRSTMLDKKNPKKAVEAAFEGVDWERFTKAWVQWVKSY